MKIVKINDKLLINIDQIYSLELNSNENELNDWDDRFNILLESTKNNTPELDIGSKKVKLNELKSEEELRQYSNALYSKIISVIGEKPEYKESYRIILISGVKVKITKEIYNVLYNELDKYCINNKSST